MFSCFNFDLLKLLLFKLLLQVCCKFVTLMMKKVQGTIRFKILYNSLFLCSYFKIKLLRFNNAGVGNSSTISKSYTTFSSTCKVFDSQHGGWLLNKLNKLRLAGEMTDITFDYKGQVYLNCL